MNVQRHSSPARPRSVGCGSRKRYMRAGSGAAPGSALYPYFLVNSNVILSILPVNANTPLSL
jgi:hypothetical protein